MNITFQDTAGGEPSSPRPVSVLIDYDSSKQRGKKINVFYFNPSQSTFYPARLSKKKQLTSIFIAETPLKTQSLTTGNNQQCYFYLF
jgi:hypothetical protein